MKPEYTIHAEICSGPRKSLGLSFLAEVVPQMSTQGYRWKVFLTPGPVGPGRMWLIWGDGETLAPHPADRAVMEDDTGLQKALPPGPGVTPKWKIPGQSWSGTSHDGIRLLTMS